MVSGMTKIMSTFLFKSNFLTLSFSDWTFFIVFAVLFVAAIIFYILKRVNRRRNVVVARLFGKMFSGFLTTAVLGGIWVGLRYLTIPYIGIRLVAVLALAGFFIWFFFVLKYLVKNFSEENKNFKEQSLREKYLR
ncbi:MAG: hypothetical protein COT91_04490 [Candidatus Doudnabacteria bacterium CG10_big_fil_rev_8_21_14_0_10_41_10]|uniref:Uncharacterized protein n=1 Tax=Candidatus Doudnabacteria bacterium CG10_big_fil_rev_8_21_14_0_10_41_10 TaxID=1974551 RepID=A0A2H0VCL9_9BACT|nr:MAG: hypothetical protein COT91_04490 [Candidatus Doudnabacteria bacterium CG10_big_fil_rev_8_21_14_0_10_41_10]